MLFIERNKDEWGQPPHPTPAEELQRVQELAARLQVRIGNLEIVAEGKPGQAGIPFAGHTTVFLDGRPFPVRSVTLHGDVDGHWTATLEFYPRAPEK